MNTPTKIGIPPRTRPRFFRVAAASLAVFLALLAIAVKTLHYTGHSAEIRYFSASVKIVKAGHKEFGSTAAISVAVIAAPRIIAAAPIRDEFARICPHEISLPPAPHITRQSLRGPPSIA